MRAHDMLSSLEKTAKLSPEFQVETEFAKGLAYGVLIGKRLSLPAEVV